MISQPVVSRKQVEDRLAELGAQPTGERIETGEAWKLKNGQHFIVPDPMGGMYPDWMLWDLEKIIGKIDPWVGMHDPGDKD